jgi:mRNA interferase MazF
MPSLPNPLRGEVWFANLDPPHQLEQAGARPCLVPLPHRLQQGPFRQDSYHPLHQNSRQPFTVSVLPPEGGLKMESHLLCDQIRAINKDRLSHKLGIVSAQTLKRVEQIVKDLLDF